MKKGYWRACLGLGLGQCAAAGVLAWQGAAGPTLPPEALWGLWGAECVLCLAQLRLLLRWVFRPVERLEELFVNWPDVERGQLEEQAGQIDGLPADTARVALERMEQLEGKLSEIGRQAAARAEADTRLALVEDLCRSALPRPLTEGDGRFALAGRVERGSGPSCAFYDYFYLDAGLLALIVGECPGDDLAAALFMVVAQTAIRSRLRLGRSLEETMADVNTQLHDLGRKRVLRALVGLLRTEDGAFACVDAGGCRPLLMKHEERYELLEHPVFAPLGENETVSYREITLRLRQGDRLFFYTGGLGEMADRGGVPFGKEQLRAVLNRSRSQEEDLDGALAFVAGEGSAYCLDEAGRRGYAALLLEYRKGSKMLAHCEVPAVPQSAPRLAAFLKGQFEANGIPPKRYAGVAVAADELFALCCRRLRRGDALVLECGMAPDGGSATLRMSARLKGANPLQQLRGAAEESAAAFIREQAEFVDFKGEGDWNTLTLVCFWD